MGKPILILLMLALFTACGGRVVKNSIPADCDDRLGDWSECSIAVPEIECDSTGIPCDLHGLPRKDVDLKWTKPSTINLKRIRKEVTWFYTPYLSDAFGSIYYGPGYLNVISKDKLLYAKLVINFYPTIWSDEKDNLIQLIQFPKLKSVGIKGVLVENGQVLQLNYQDLFDLPDNVKKQVLAISRQELLSELELSGKNYEFENWPNEKEIWKHYIMKYHPGDFIRGQENNRFEVCPNLYYLQLVFKGKKSNYIVNLCDEVIIGN